MKMLIKGSAVALLTILAGCASTPNPAVGVWDVSLNTPVGAMPATLTIAEDGTGTMSMADVGSAAISGVMVDGNALSFVTEVDAQGQLLVLNFSGTVEGDALDGEFSSDFGPFAASGTRQ
ncbi:MAG: hypothetical protein WDZ76_02005 [Pseudohongiellaceae bacterium]